MVQYLYGHTRVPCVNIISKTKNDLKYKYTTVLEYGTVYCTHVRMAIPMVPWYSEYHMVHILVHVYQWYAMVLSLVATMFGTIALVATMVWQ
jgi:hypothetical protein